MFFAYLLVGLREVAHRRLSDVGKAARGWAGLSGVATGCPGSGGSGEGAAYGGRLGPRFCLGAPVCFSRTVPPGGRVFLGRPRLPVRRASRHRATTRCPARLAPSVSRVRAPVGSMTRPTRRLAFFNTVRSWRPHGLSPRTRGARSIHTMVQPCDASGATGFLTLVSSSAPARRWGTHGGGKANTRSVCFRHCAALASDSYDVCSHHTGGSPR